MGNRHSVRQVSRRRPSLVKEEFDFPQPAFDVFDDDWEIYHVEVELETLPPHTRHTIKIRVHEYTQEIISCEEECTGESSTCKSEKDQEECSGETINTCISDKDRVCVDEDKASEKKNRDERGLRPGCLRNDTESSRNSDSSTKCSRCQTVLETGCSQDNSSNRTPTDNIAEPKGTELAATNGERLETECVSHDMFLQWELSLEEPCQPEDSATNTKARRTREFCQDDPSLLHLDKSCKTIPSSQSDRDVGVGGSVTERSDTERDTLDIAPSSLKRDRQTTPRPWDRLPALCDACSYSSSAPPHNTTSARSLPMQIPTASTMLYKFRPHLRSTRRKMSDPTLRLKTPTPLTSPKLQAKSRRRVSLKDDPGWIPNPLDSDEDEDDMEDSGVFSDATGSPRSPGRLHGPVSGSPGLAARRERSGSTAQSSTPPLPEPPLREYPTAAELARRRLALQTGRRRYNSEPTPVAPKTSASSDTCCDSEEELGMPGGNSRSSSASDDSTCSKRQSGWRLVKLVWGRRASKADAVEGATTTAAASSSSVKRAAEQEKEEELDLDKQLEWMTKVPNSEPPTPSEDRDAIDFSYESAASEPFRKVSFSDTHTNPKHPPPTSQPSSSAMGRKVTFTETHPEKVNVASHSHPTSAQLARKPATSEDPEDQGRNPEGQELELDWLCEPEWNNFELELFWNVLRPHMERLLQCGDAENLPDPCVTVFAMDAKDHKMLDRCLLHVQWHIWKGNYCQAVSDFRAVRRHFRCCAESHLIESETRDDVESLRLVFQRKRPSRFRFWI